MTNTELEEALTTITTTFTKELIRQKGKVLEKVLGKYVVNQGQSEYHISIERVNDSLLFKMCGLKDNLWITGEFSLYYDGFFESIKHEVKVDYGNMELVKAAAQLTPIHYNKLFRKKRIYLDIEKSTVNKKPKTSLTREVFIDRLLDGYNHNLYLHELTGEARYEKRYKRIKQFLHYFTAKTQRGDQ